jgi:myo-inositol-1(or 4)-monophosphatase
VACGIFDGFFEMGLKKWDMAAGAILVQEAGGLLTDWKGGNAWFETGDVVAGNLWVQQNLVDVLKG